MRKPREEIYLTRTSLKELSEGKIIYDDDGGIVIHPPKTDEELAELDVLYNKKKLDQKVIDLLDKAGEHAFEVMVEQMKTNPDAIEALYSDGKIFCQWVDSRVDFTDLPPACRESVKDGKCVICQRSPQLDMGMSVADLMRNIKV